MTCETNKPAALDASDPSQSGYASGYAPFFVRAFWIVCGATLLIFLMFFSQGFIKLSETGRRLFAIFIFSACIVLPSMILVTQITIR